MKQTVKGEEIFESNAVIGENGRDAFLDALAYKTQDSDKECFITTSINPEDSFQVFNGKLFEIPRNEYSIADSVERRVESPLQRFSRLRSELDELKNDLDSMVDSDDSNKSSVWSILQNETSKLIVSSRKLENHKSLAGTRAVTNSDFVTPKITLVNSDTSTVKYIDNAVVGDQEFIHLERRIHQLETVLGYSQNCSDDSVLRSSDNKNSPFSSYPLVETLSRLEQRVSMLDSAHLEGLRTKTAALKSDLETVSKIKASSATSASETKAVEAARKVEDLVAGVKKMEAVAEDLPALVLRLKTLERIHLSAGIFTSRLSQVEDELRGAVGDLKSNKEVLSALKEGFAENIAIMQQNVAAMDARLSVSTK